MWENERKFPFVGWKPLDSAVERSNFSTLDGRTAPRPEDYVCQPGYIWMVWCDSSYYCFVLFASQLIDNVHDLSHVRKPWNVQDDWEVDHKYAKTDANGWTYAVNFVGIGATFRGQEGFFDSVRRRRWIRHALVRTCNSDCYDWKTPNNLNQVVETSLTEYHASYDVLYTVHALIHMTHCRRAATMTCTQVQCRTHTYILRICHFTSLLIQQSWLYCFRRRVHHHEACADEGTAAEHAGRRPR